MFLKSVANAVTSRVGRQILVAQKHSPGILFGVGVVGMAVTVVLASRATLKLDRVLQTTELHKEKAKIALDMTSVDYTEQDYQKDMVIVYTKLVVELAKLYGPALVMGIASIAALTGSHVVLNRRYLGVTAAYAAIDKGFNEYRRRVTNELGLEKDREFRYGLTDKEIVEEDEHGSIVKTVKGLGGKDVSVYARFFDESCKSWSKQPGYNQIFLTCQQNYANDLLRSRGHVFLNEVYDVLGIPRTKAGAVVGWVQSDCGDGFIDFGVFSGDVYMGMEFVRGNERSVLLDFNVDGVIYDKI